MQGTKQSVQPQPVCSLKVKYHCHHNLDITQVSDFSTFRDSLPLAFLEKIGFISCLLLSQFHATGGFSLLFSAPSQDVLFLAVTWNT